MPVTTTCPIQTAVEVMGGKWKPGILSRLRDRTLRFGELRREMPWMSERVLIRQLKELVRDGIVTRTDHGEMPPRVDYRLTAYGETLAPVLDAMGRWGRVHLGRQGASAPAECPEPPSGTRPGTTTP